MAQSLFRSDPNCQLYAFAFDAKCEAVLKAWNHPRLKVISLSEFESEALLSVKAERTTAEYCWTCTPSVLDYCMNVYGLDHCTYLDADLFFYSSPRPLIEEMGDKSILITEHRYSPEHDFSRECGIYCVQFITFKADAEGLRALDWWRKACLEWCFDRREEGRYGDQKYLDDWTERFKGVHVLEHLGGGVAPWNVQQYEIRVDDGKLYVRQGNTEMPLIFYHFHYLAVLSSGRVHYGPYRLTDSHRLHIYRFYCDQLMSVRKLLTEKNPDIPLYSDMKDGFLKRFYNKPLRKRLRPMENMCEVKYGKNYPFKNIRGHTREADGNR